MRSLNKVILIGNLTRDPEIRTTMSNQSITLFGIATNRDWMTRDGRREQSAEFHEIVCFARLGEVAQRTLKKGSLVHIEGYLKTRSWDDAAGVKKFRTEIVAENLVILEKRSAPKSTDFPEAEAAFDPSQSTVSIENPVTL